METRHAEALISFFDDLDACTDAMDLQNRFSEATQAFGIKCFHYYRVPTAVNSGENRLHSISTLPSGWVDYYVAERYQTDDVWHDVCHIRNRPTMWSEVTKRVRLNAFQRRMLADGFEAGLFDGLTVPASDGLAEGFVSLAADEPGNDGTTAVARNAPVLGAMATAFHRRASAILFHDQPDPTPRRSAMSPREREILQWVAIGKTDWEISQILNITERAVKFHVAGARRKLRATNRTHAVAVAVSAHLIDNA